MPWRPHLSSGEIESLIIEIRAIIFLESQRGGDSENRNRAPEAPDTPTPRRNWPRQLFPVHHQRVQDTEPPRSDEADAACACGGRTPRPRTSEAIASRREKLEDNASSTRRAVLPRPTGGHALADAPRRQLPARLYTPVRCSRTRRAFLPLAVLRARAHTPPGRGSESGRAAKTLCVHIWVAAAGERRRRGHE